MIAAFIGLILLSTQLTENPLEVRSLGKRLSQRHGGIPPSCWVTDISSR